MQIYLRELTRGAPPPWAEVLLANLLAWLPWLLLVAPVLRLERRFPIAGPDRWRNGLLHLASAVAVSATFLLYLALFHLVYLGDGSLPLSVAAARAKYFEILGRFFLTATALYGLIVVAGFAERTWRLHRQALQQPIVEDRRRSLDAESIVVRSTGRLERIDPTEVRWIAGEGNYARLQLDGRSVLHRRSLASLSAELGSRRFVRVHRSIIVNLSHVRSLRHRSHGDAVVVLDDGSQLKVSRTYRKALKRLGLA